MILYRELSYRIVSCAMAVHKELGPGFTENIYEEAMVLELASRKIGFERQKRFPVFYRQRQIGIFALDLVVEGLIGVELKAKPEIVPIHCAQASAYLKASCLALASIINFGEVKLKQKRIIRQVASARPDAAVE